MQAPNSTEAKLQERIKELTCLYTINSYIANCDFNEITPTLEAIAESLKNALLYSEDASVEIYTNGILVTHGRDTQGQVFLLSAIKAFNKNIGSIKVGYSKQKYTNNSFLDEEKQLLNAIAIELGNLFERQTIINNEKRAREHVARVDRLAILGEITAGIAHELNTPLANILGYSELLKEQLQDQPTIIEDVNKIISSAVYSREVVKKLMFFSCDMPQHKTETNIVPLIEEAIRLLKPSFKKKQLKCELQALDGVIMYKLDSIQLTQMLFNLLINAIYYSPENGLITVVATQDQNNVTLEIKDGGTGIDPKHGDAIFNPFYTTKPVGEGSGLGLSVVHGIVKSHKGSIAYQANQPSGTTFIIKFPKAF